MESAKSGVPAVPDRVVERPEVSARLDEALSRPLTTLTAPAGYGKTVAVAQWCRRQECPVVWVDLSDTADDPSARRARVIDAVCAGLGIDPSVANRSLAVGELPPLLAVAPRTIFVFDGIPAWDTDHTLELAAVLSGSHDCELRGLAISRCPPSPELTPLEMQGVVSHLTVADLWAGADEVAAVVEAYSGRPLDGATAEELATSLDGWIAGAVITGLRRPPGPAGETATSAELLAAAWEGIEAYLTAEVIGQLPADIRAFVLPTACVDELSGELCDRITGRSDSGSMLRSFVAAGVPLARNRTGRDTYRYQPQFRAVVDSIAQREDAERRAAALRMAADWYNEHEQPFEAAECLVRLGEWDEVVGTVLLHMQAIIENDEFGRMASLVMRAPTTVLRQHAALIPGGASVLVYEGRPTAANELLSVYQQHMTQPQRMVADMVRSSMYPWLEDMSVPVAAASSAVVTADEVGDDYVYDDVYNPSTTDFYRVQARAWGAAAAALGGLWQQGRSFLVDISPETAAGVPHIFALQIRGARALHLVLTGEVSVGLQEATLALSIASEAGLTDNRNAADAHYAIGEGRRLSGAFDEAAGSLERVAALAEVNGRRNLTAAATASRAHLLVDTGRPKEAIELLDRYRVEARHRAPLTLAGLLAAAEARALMAVGDYFAALRVIGEAPSTSATAAVEVAVALALDDLERARDVVRRWPDEPTAVSTVRRALAVALLRDATGSSRDRERSLRAGLVAAMTHELVQPVAEWGAPMGRLLHRVDRNGRDRGVVELARRVERLIAGDGASEPLLTRRESVVMAHLDSGLSVPAVAREMAISAHTVKSHTKSIYRKLGARTRAEALAAWRETRPTRSS